MKNIFYVISLMFIIAGISSCSDDEDQVVATASTAAVLSELENPMVDLDSNFPNNLGATFVWTAADYGAQTVVNYAVEIASDEAFTEPYQLANTLNLSYSLTVDDLNTALINAGFGPNEEATIYVRVVSFLGTDFGLPNYSNVISFTAEPYATYLFKDLYLVGPASAAGWSENNNNPLMFRDVDNENLYTYTGYFNMDALKFLEIRGQWAPQYGQGTNANELAYRPTEDVADPPAINVPSAGYHVLTVNLSNNTYSFAPYDTSGATTYNSMAVIGDAVGGWDDANEVELTALSSDPHIWYAEGVALANGGMKFRANDGWDANWGGTNSYNQQGVFNSNDNIPGIAGTYRIWFNDLTGDYMIVPTE